MNIKIEQQYIIDLVSYSLFKTPFDYSKYENTTLNYKYIATKIHEQKMEGLVYYALKNLKIENKLFLHIYNSYMTILFTSAQQENEYKQLIKLFEDNSIDYVPLKGISIKHYYPTSEMRLMGDVDILIPTQKQVEVRELLLNNEYKLVYPLENSNHHEVFKKEYTTFEIHYRLFDKQKEENLYIDNLVWKETTNHTFNVEFNLLYLISHYKKHFSHGGASYKSLLDIGLILEKENINKEKLNKYLKETNNYSFFNNIITVYNKVFNRNVFCFEKTFDEKQVETINELIFKCGDFGFGKENNADKTIIYQYFSNKKISLLNKIGHLISRICIPYKTFKKQSKIIKYCPILLPFGWIVRFFALCFSKKRNIKEKINNVKNISEKDIKDYKDHLELINALINEK